MNDELMPPVGEMSSALANVNRSDFMPAMTIESAVERYGAITEFISRVLRKDIDYGMIPGTDKLTLLKPGAEKLTTFFGLSTRFQLIERIEDWTGGAYGGEPFFYYLYRCQLYRGDLLIAEADGSCNSRETKYRWRESQRVCLVCNQAAIIKGREEFGGGWICFKKKGGCGAKFQTGDASIEGQPTGRVPNPDIADQVNTIQKMGQKRALVAATLMAVNASEFFTQDVEDVGPGAAVYSAQPAPSPYEIVNRNEEDAALVSDILDACRTLGKTEAQLTDWLKKKYGAASIEELKTIHKHEVLLFLQNRLRKEKAA